MLIFHTKVINAMAFNQGNTVVEIFNLYLCAIKQTSAACLCINIICLPLLLLTDAICFVCHTAQVY